MALHSFRFLLDVRHDSRGNTVAYDVLDAVDGNRIVATFHIAAYGSAAVAQIAARSQRDHLNANGGKSLKPVTKGWAPYFAG